MFGCGLALSLKSRGNDSMIWHFKITRKKLNFLWLRKGLFQMNLKQITSKMRTQFADNCMSVVSFNQLSDAACNQTLIKILFSAFSGINHRKTVFLTTPWTGSKLFNFVTKCSQRPLNGVEINLSLGKITFYQTSHNKFFTYYFTYKHFIWS